MRFIIAFLLFSSTLCGQIDQSPAMLVSSLSVISSSAPNYTVQGSFSSQFGYTRDSIQEGVDVMWLNYTISNPDRPIRALIDSFTVISGNTLRFYVELLDGETVLAFPTGTASIYRPTTNYSLILEEPNESSTTKAQKHNANMLAIDAAIAAAGGGGADSTIFSTNYGRDTSAQALRDEIAALAQPPFDSTDIATGGIGNTDLASGIITSSKIATGAVGATALASTTVTAGAYNAATVTFDADGRATAAADGAKPIYAPLCVALLGSSGSDATLVTATALDRIPTTSLSTGTVVEFVASNTLYTYILRATPNSAENPPFNIFPNDYHVTTNAKYWQQALMPQQVYDVTRYGASGQDAAVDSDAILAAMAAMSTGDILWFPPGITYTCYTLTINKSIRWVGNDSRLKIVTGTNSGLLSISGVEDVSIDGFVFEGQGKTASGVSNQNGLNVAGGGSNNLAIGRTRITNCRFYNFPGYAISVGGTFTSKSDSLFTGSIISNCVIDRCTKGFVATIRGEYWTFANSVVTRCDTGMSIGAGNIIVTGCNINNNKVNVSIVPGVNDAHGVFSNCQINHPKSASNIRISGITNGQRFTNCNIYYGSIVAQNSVGVVFDGGMMDVDSILLGGAATTAVFQNITFGVTLAKGVNTSYGSASGTVRFLNNFNIDGTQNVLRNFTPDWRVGNYKFNTDQTVGAGQDNYVMTYDNGTGEIGLEAAPDVSTTNELITGFAINGSNVRITEAATNHDLSASSIVAAGSGFQNGLNNYTGYVTFGLNTNRSLNFFTNNTYGGQLDSLGHWRFGPGVVTGTSAWHTFTNSTSTNGIKIVGSSNAYVLLGTSLSESSWDASLRWDNANTALKLGTSGAHEVLLQPGGATVIEAVAAGANVTGILNVTGTGTEPVQGYFTGNDENGAIYVQNSTTGTGSTNGLSIAMANSDATISNRESGTMTFSTAGMAAFSIDANQYTIMNNRLQGKKGSDVASATDITLGSGNAFSITGTTTINTVVTTNWQAGSEVTLFFDTSLTVNDNDTSAGNIKLAGSADFSATADDVLLLKYDGTNWREISRSVN